ncbi:MAG TPA: MFS transporter, partial [Bacillales bacterium]|nr:MFS transporter [Bacillales bacterium]
AAVFEPAKEGKLKEIVDDELMQPAVATSELINNGAKIIGPIISGVLVAGIGIQWSFYLDSLSFLASAALLLGVPKSVKRAKVSVETSEASASLFSQFKAGFTFMKKIPALLTGLIVFAVMILVLQLGDSQFVVLLREVPGDPIHILGWVMAGSGAGVVISSLYLNNKEIRSCLTALTLASSGLGAGYILAGLCIHLPTLWVSILYPTAGVVFGFCFGMGLIPFNVMAQKLTPSDYTGRVFGTISSVTTLAAVTGMLGGGFLTEWFGVVHTYVISGGLLVLIGVIVYSFRKRMQGGEINAKGDAGTHREAQV